MKREARTERTGWRDAALSARHRQWGWDCPAIDIDFLMIEYDTGQPVALVEYKHERAQKQKASHPSYQAIINLGDRAGLPVFCVRYAGDFSEWIVTPLNSYADERTDRNILTLSESQYVNFLYTLRGRETL